MDNRQLMDDALRRYKDAWGHERPDLEDPLEVDLFIECIVHVTRRELENEIIRAFDAATARLEEGR